MRCSLALKNTLCILISPISISNFIELILSISLALYTSYIHITYVEISFLEPRKRLCARYYLSFTCTSSSHSTLLLILLFYLLTQRGTTILCCNQRIYATEAIRFCFTFNWCILTVWQIWADPKRLTESCKSLFFHGFLMELKLFNLF